MAELKDLPNIGGNLVEKLEKAGIKSVADFKSAGSENAFIRIKTIDETACINMLYALEGAMQNIRWHGISKDRKAELFDFFNSIK